MYGTRYIFSRGFFRAWVVVTFLIAWAASLTIIIMPLWQGRHTLYTFGRYVMVAGRNRFTTAHGPVIERSVDHAKLENAGEDIGLKV
jgi:hypothetical protein